MGKMKSSADWRRKFLDDLLEYTEISAEAIPTDFEDSFDEAIAMLSDRDADIIRRHYKEKHTYQAIAQTYGVTRALIGKRSLDALNDIRKSPFLYALAWGKDYKELHDEIVENIEIVSLISTKTELLRIFNEVKGAKENKISNRQIDDRVKVIFESLGIDNAEELLSFNLEEFIVAAGALLGEPTAKEELEKFRDSRKYPLSLRIADIGLSTRAVHCLHSNGVYVIGDIFKYSYSDINSFKYAGINTSDEIKSKLKEYNVKLRNK